MDEEEKWKIACRNEVDKVLNYFHNPPKEAAEENKKALLRAALPALLQDKKVKKIIKKELKND